MRCEGRVVSARCVRGWMVALADSGWVIRGERAGGHSRVSSSGKGEGHPRRVACYAAARCPPPTVEHKGRETVGALKCVVGGRQPGRARAHLRSVVAPNSLSRGVFTLGLSNLSSCRMIPISPPLYRPLKVVSTPSKNITQWLSCSPSPGEYAGMLGSAIGRVPGSLSGGKVAIFANGFVTRRRMASLPRTPCDREIQNMEGFCSRRGRPERRRGPCC